jgi:uroporphyrinogen III methyltransferase/synthase
MLTGKRIVVTRAREKADELAQKLEELGAAVVFSPTIRYLPPDEPERLRAARIAEYDWILFTSPQGVQAFFQEPGPPPRARIGCIGPATANALPHGIACQVLPDEHFLAEGLLEALRPYPVEGQRILLPRAAEAREVLPETLRKRGASVDVVPAYRTVPEETLNPEVLALKIDAVTFTSSSTVKGFHQLLKGRPAMDFPSVAIGPITAETARDLGFPLLATAKEHTIPGLLQALQEAFQNDPA